MAAHSEPGSGSTEGFLLLKRKLFISTVTTVLPRIIDSDEVKIQCKLYMNILYYKRTKLTLIRFEPGSEFDSCFGAFCAGLCDDFLL